MQFSIRDEAAGDEAEIAHVHESAFGDHGTAVVELVRAIRLVTDGASTLSLVAVADARVVGHILFSPSTLDAPPRLLPVQVLSPVGVLPNWQRRGVARALIERGLTVLDARAAPLVFLEGDPSFYRRLGFEPAGPLGFRRPSLRIPEPAFQVRRLSSAEPWMTGTLVYAPVFWEQDAVGLR